MVRFFLCMLTLCSLSSAWSGCSNSDVLHATSWETNATNPFSPCNVKWPSYASAGSCPTTTRTNTQMTGGYTFAQPSTGLIVSFNETGFDGTRDDKGAEVCVFQNNTKSNAINMHKAGWQGFGLLVPGCSYPQDKHAIIAQQFCPGRCTSWCGTVSIANNSLVVDHRNACGGSTTTTVVESIQRDTWHSIVVHFVVSAQEEGVYQLWYDNELVYNTTGINVGFGDSWTNDTIDNGFYFKNGIYAYDTDAYTNATRKLYFSDMSWLADDNQTANGLSIVTPRVWSFVN